MNFQVYTSSSGSKTGKYIVPDNQLWDSQVLVCEYNSLEEIERFFKKKLRFNWMKNSVFYLQDPETSLVLTEEGGYEIHCKSNNNLKIKPPTIENGKIFYKNVPRGGGTYRNLKYRKRDEDGKLMRDSSSDEDNY